MASGLWLARRFLVLLVQPMMREGKSRNGSKTASNNALIRIYLYDHAHIGLKNQGRKLQLFDFPRTAGGVVYDGRDAKMEQKGK